MNRIQILLIALGAVLIGALFFVFVVQPQREELADLQDQARQQQEQQAMVQAEIDRLRAVRDDAPEVQAFLAAAETVVPRDAALPAALRHFQLAADEAGLTLNSITTSRPASVPDATAGLVAIDLNISMVGGYFQLVDFLRRVEDPQITARGVVWQSANLSVAEYPSLNIALNGRMFAFSPVPAPPPTEETDADQDSEETDADQDSEEPGEEDT